MIAVDASIWVSYLVQTDTYHAVSQRWLSKILSEGQPIVAPVLLLAEVGGAIARQSGRPELGQRTIDRLLGIPNLRLIGIDHALGIQAARLAAERRLRGADAIYVAAAAALNVPLISWDREQLGRAEGIANGRTPE
jgi:predicted nucleic acid-binding protein